MSCMLSSVACFEPISLVYFSTVILNMKLIFIQCSGNRAANHSVSSSIVMISSNNVVGLVDQMPVSSTPVPPFTEQTNENSPECVSNSLLEVHKYEDKIFPRKGQTLCILLEVTDLSIGKAVD